MDDESTRWRKCCETLLMQRMLELKGISVRYKYRCALDCRFSNNALKVNPIHMTKRLMSNLRRLALQRISFSAAYRVISVPASFTSSEWVPFEVSATVGAVGACNAESVQRDSFSSFFNFLNVSSIFLLVALIFF